MIFQHVQAQRDEVTDTQEVLASDSISCKSAIDGINKVLVLYFLLYALCKLKNSVLLESLGFWGHFTRFWDYFGGCFKEKIKKIMRCVFDDHIYEASKIDGGSYV